MKGDCMKCECMIGKFRHINSTADKFLTEKINEERIPVLKNHIPLFYLLPLNSDSMMFNELSKEWGISKSSLSDIVNKYEKLGFVNKCSCCDDKRLIYLSLTKEGVKIKETLVRLEVAFIELLFKGFDNKARDHLENQIDHLLDNSNQI